MGVAAYPNHGSTLEALLREADSGLYLAKAEGRDRIRTNTPVPTPDDVPKARKAQKRGRPPEMASGDWRSACAVTLLPGGTERAMPGDNVALVIELITPVAMEKGLRFAIREGGRTVGAGTISEILA
jgi:hypothetical protein